MALSAQVRCLRWQPSAHRNPLQRVSDLMAVAAKFGTASDAERSLVFLTIINDLGLGYCFHLDEFELVVDDREELRDFVHIRACALGRRNSLGNRSPDIDGDGQNLDAGGIRIARSLDNFSAYKPKPTPTHTN